MLQGIPVILPSTIGNRKNKYLLVPLLWPANETLKQYKNNRQRKPHFTTQRYNFASLESVLSELKGLTEEYSIKYDEANLGTIMLSYFSQISEALSGSDGCMSHSLIKQ